MRLAAVSCLVAVGLTAPSVYAAPSSGHGRGVVRMRIAGDLWDVDPAAVWDQVGWQLESATCAKLVDYAEVDGEVHLVPSLAESLPEVSGDGRTYDFVVPPRSRFAPPSRESITAAVLARSLERARDPDFFGPGEGGPGSGFLADVDRIEVPAQNHLRIHLREPSGDFLHRLALPFFCAVPSTYPMGYQTEPPPGSGPYTISRYVPVRWGDDGPLAPGAIVVERNPGYRGARLARPDAFIYRTGVSAEVDDVVSGRADYLPEGLGVEGLAELRATYGSTHAAARLLEHALLGYRFVAMDARRLSAAYRQGIAYALDRRASADLMGGLADDGLIPPGLAGRPAGHLYPIDGPDLATAEALLAGGPTTLVLACADVGLSCPLGEQVAADLAAVGVEVDVVALDPGEYYASVLDEGSTYDLVMGGWSVDYPDAANMLEPLFTPDGGFDLAHFADADITARLAAARPTAGTARAAAYEAIASDLMEAAPVAVVADSARRDFVSARVGCDIYNPVYGLVLGAMCVHRTLGP